MLELRFVDNLSHEVIDSSWTVSGSDSHIGLAPLPGETLTLRIGDKKENFKVVGRHWNLDHKSVYETRIDIYVKRVY